MGIERVENWIWSLRVMEWVERTNGSLMGKCDRTEFWNTSPLGWIDRAMRIRGDNCKALTRFLQGKRRSEIQGVLEKAQSAAQPVAQAAGGTAVKATWDRTGNTCTYCLKWMSALDFFLFDCWLWLFFKTVRSGKRCNFFFCEEQSGVKLKKKKRKSTKPGRGTVQLHLLNPPVRENPPPLSRPACMSASKAWSTRPRIRFERLIVPARRSQATTHLVVYTPRSRNYVKRILRT